MTSSFDNKLRKTEVENPIENFNMEMHTSRGGCDVGCGSGPHEKRRRKARTPLPQYSLVYIVYSTEMNSHGETPTAALLSAYTTRELHIRGREKIQTIHKLSPIIRKLVRQHRR